MYRAVRALVVVGFILTLATCRDGMEPQVHLAPIAVAPVLPSDAALASFGLAIDRVRFIVVRPSASPDTLADTTVALPPDAATLDIALRVPLIAAAETLQVSIVVLSGTIPLFEGTAPVEVTSRAPPATPTEIPVQTYVGPGAGVDSIAITPALPFIFFNDSLRFQVEAFQAGAPVSQFYVSWSSSDTNVARVNGVGLLRAPAARTSVRVVARTPGNGAVDSTTATFVPFPTELLVIAGAGQTSVVGQALPTQLEVEVRSLDNLPVPGVDVRFRSLSGGTPADTIVKSDTQGRARVTGVLGPTPGAQSFQASLPAFPGITAPFNATATAIPISAATSIVTVASGSVVSGNTVKLRLQTKDATGNDITTGGATVVFTQTGGTSTGTISATADSGNGVYTAVFTGVLAGTATTIGATINGSPVTTPLPTIAVTPGAIASVAVTPASITLDALDATQQFAAQALDLNANLVAGATFTWGTSDGLVASVDNAGLATALANGTVIINATAGGVTGGASLTIAQAVTTVTVSPPAATLQSLNATQQFTALAFDRLGNPLATPPAFTWSSINTLVARVNQTGLATSVANGATKITAASGGVADTVDLTVQQIVATVAVTPDRVLLTSVGATVQLTAVARDAGGSAIAGATFAWSSSNPLAGTVDAAGLVTAIAIGATDITAATAGKSGVAQVTIDVLGSATRLVFIQQPPSPVFFNEPFTVQVAAEDGLGNIVTSFSGNITLSENAGSRNSLSKLQGTLTQPAVAGVATFTDILVDGTDTTAIDAIGDALASATSNTFEVVNQLLLKAGDGIGERPYFAGVDTNTNRVYVSNTVSRNLSVVDAATNKGVALIDMGAHPGWEGVNPFTQRVFVSDSLDGDIKVIDEPGEKIEVPVPLGAAAAQPTVDVENELVFVPATPDALELFVLDGKGGYAVVNQVTIGAAGDIAAGAVWDARNRWVWVVIPNRGIVRAVDPFGRQIMDEFVAGELPYGVAIDTARQQLYVTLAGQAGVVVYDIAGKRPLQTIPVGSTPQGLSVDEKTGRVYVANFGDNSISVLDAVDFFEIARIPVMGLGPGDAEFNPKNGLVYVPNGTDGSLSIIKP